MLRKDDAVLVFVDVQGRLAEVMDGVDVLNRNLERMVKGMQLLEVPVLVTEQLPDKLGPTQEPYRSLLQGSEPIAKSAFSCCGEPLFMEALNAYDRKQVVLVGIEAHVCVYQTAMDLVEQGFEVVVVADAVGSRCPQNKALALAAMREAGAEILPTESVLFALIRNAAAPWFKELLGLIK